MNPHSLALALFAGAGSALAQTIERVDVGPGGVEATSYQEPYVAISDDGRFVAFSSASPNLVVGDVNNFEDVFVRDRSLGITIRVSVDSAGMESNYTSWRPSISGDGRFVLFSSGASNLVAADYNGSSDAFVHDLQTGSTERVSVDSAGVEAYTDSDAFSISFDGRFVAFASTAPNLVAGDTNNVSDCFVHDRLTGITERVNVSSSGAEAALVSAAPILTPDGRFVAFGSRAWNLVSGDTNLLLDIFVHDRQTGLTERVSVSSSGVQANANSNGGDLPWALISISPDGRFVAFGSHASNLVPGDTNGFNDTFLRDRLNGTTERVTLDSSGAQADSYSEAPGVSPDGRYVRFKSRATNLVAGDTNSSDDLFVRDRLSGSTVRVSGSPAGAQDNGSVMVSALTPDGHFLAFVSFASNLVAGDTNATADVFVLTLGAPPVVPFCTPGVSGAIGCPCSNPPAGTARGCDNSSVTGGAALSASGNASLAADTLLFATAGETPTGTSIVVQGTSASFSGVVFGQGVRCVSGALKRMYVHTAAGGSIQAPSGSDLSVSARSAALGDAITAGEHRFYMVQYRDPVVLGGCPSASTFNATNAADVPWSP